MSANFIPAGRWGARLGFRRQITWRERDPTKNTLYCTLDLCAPDNHCCTAGLTRGPAVQTRQPALRRQLLARQQAQPAPVPHPPNTTASLIPPAANGQQDTVSMMHGFFLHCFLRNNASQSKCKNRGQRTVEDTLQTQVAAVRRWPPTHHPAPPHRFPRLKHSCVKGPAEHIE